jgi:hypothetical protein
MKSWNRWSKEELSVLRRNYRNHSTFYVASMLGRTEECTKKKANRMGLKKTKTYLRTFLNHNI